MICFQICTFEPLETTNQRCNEFTLRCDLLSNLYLWTIGNNIGISTADINIVVICFQICTFEPLETTPSTLITKLILLWFAFKFVPLNHWKQHHNYYHTHRQVVICFQICTFEPLETTQTRIGYAHLSCDLLSNLYLWTIGNNGRCSLS